MTRASLPQRDGNPTIAWRRATFASAVLAVLAVALLVTRVAGGVRANALVRVDNITVVMLCLVALIGVVVTRYSTRYLAGEPGEARAATRLIATLGSVSVVVVANDLVVLLLAWCATSLSMHGLLTFYGHRPAAVAAAHKKFILARLADACMVGAVAAFVTAFGTTRIDRIAADAVVADALNGGLPWAARIGIVLVATAALLKCAQLPFHGWLIQVMEAPTPVSALLHAGVVNLGGFVLLRFAPVVDRTVEARSLLVVVGVATAVVAALVRTTRISVKVALAWSTCAQMGFMLVQCGLGLWEMALLHLVAHSLYKAHAFLGAGGTVRAMQRDRLLAHPAATTIGSLAAGVALAAAGTAVVSWLWLLLPFATPLSATVWVFVGLVALAVAPLAQPFAQPLARQFAGGAGRFGLLARVLAVPAAYLVLHEVAGRLAPKGVDAPVALLVVAAVGVVVLFVVQSTIAVAPAARWVTRMRPWLYRGGFLDERFTRLAFAVWPPPAVAAPTALLPVASPAVVLPSASASAPAIVSSPAAAPIGARG